MMTSSGFQEFVLAHIVQFSIAITLVAVIVRWTSQRWPHFTFLVCMLALAKCLVPPLITSPAGLFTRYSGLAFSPGLRMLQHDELVRLKHAAVRESQGGIGTTSDHATFFIEPVSQSSVFGFSWFLLLIGVWGAGAVVVLGRALYQYAALIRIVRESTPAPAEVQMLVRQLKDKLQLRRNVRVVVSKDNYGPASVGVFQPTLVVPRVLVSRWSTRLLTPVLAHELVHARRGDVIWGHVQFAAQVLWWFHPLVWWIGRRAHLMCERCCDEEVVAELRCSAAEYAESLVRVLALKNAFRLIPCGYGMSPAEITGQRLERLVKRCGQFSRGTSRLSWVLAAALAVVLLPGMRWVQGQDERSQKTDGVTYRARVNQAINDGQWRQAVELLRPLVESDPKNGNAVFFLGYTLHADGRLDEALIYHKKATNFPRLKPVALYNWACVLALQGKANEALKKLEESLDAGFSHNIDWKDDSDLQSLFGLDGFKRLHQRAKRSRKQVQLAGELEFLLGQWSVVAEDGRVVGQNTFTRSDGGHVVMEKWKSAAGETGTSVNYYHPGTKTWKGAYVDDQGGVIEYEGGLTEGNLELRGVMFSANGQEALSRMSFKPSPNGSVEHSIENSKDNGKTWEVYFKGTYRRTSEAETNELADIEDFL